MIYLTTLRNSINLFLSNPTWDILLLLFFFAAVFVYGLMVGRNRVIVLLLASYPAALINQYLPYPVGFLEKLNVWQSFFIRSFSFFILVLLIFWVLSRAGFLRKELNKKTGQILFLSFLNVGFWANIVFGYALALKPEIITLAPLTQLLFGSNSAHLVWLIFPIGALYWFTRP